MISFDADRCVHDLIEYNSSVSSEIIEAFGLGICDTRGVPSRERLRNAVFHSEQHRRKLEEILHPRVRESWTALAYTARKNGSTLLADIPLLYETGASTDFDVVIVVAAREETQIERLTKNRGLAPELATNIIRAQLELSTKIQQADHVIWNDSTVSNLDGQTRLLASWLKRRFS